MYNFLTVGSDCSPASALRQLKLREFALPFDWVHSRHIESIEKCFADNFSKYHTNLRLNRTRTRLIDEYGFEFPHDYPREDVSNNADNVGEGVFAEDKNTYIVHNWSNYYDIVKEKYNRRIERFLKIINDQKPIIILCRWNTNEVIRLKGMFEKYYNKTNIIFINSSSQPYVTETIINCYTERNNIWNEAQIWKENIDKFL